MYQKFPHQAAKQLFDDGSKIPLVKVDATDDKNSAVSSEYGVQGYPTIKWFVGGEGTDYDGPREAAGIVDWVKSMTGPAVEEKAPTGDEKLSVGGGAMCHRSFFWKFVMLGDDFGGWALRCL